MHDSAILSQPVAVRDWKPDFPAGTLQAVFLHWTAGDYTTASASYHFCLSGSTAVSIQATHDLRANMRDVRLVAADEYAAHTHGRNSFAAGIAACAMQSATPHDFAAYPISASQVEALCIVAAAVVRWYGLPIAAVRTHAEAAVEDGYFGSGEDDVRWDIARLEPSVSPLRPIEASQCGNLLRDRISHYL